MEMDYPPTAESKNARVGAGALARPAERSSADVGLSSDNFERFRTGELRSPARTRASGPTCDLPITALPSSRRRPQDSGKTVRHHKVAVDDPSSPPELIQAESAIEKQDYATAEPLLKKVVADDPENYAAWFDLGFLYNALGKTDDSIAAYRKSVAAKPSVFESNLNLGLMLVKAGPA